MASRAGLDGLAGAVLVREDQEGVVGGVEGEVRGGAGIRIRRR